MSGPAYSIGSRQVPGLSKLIEECGEVQQVAGKIIGLGGMTTHWDGSNLRDRMEDEVSDLYAALDHFVAENGFSEARIHKRRTDKLELFERWATEISAGSQKP